MSEEMEFAPLRDISGEKYDAQRIALREEAKRIISGLSPEELTELEADLYRVNYTTEDFNYCEKVKDIGFLVLEWKKLLKTSARDTRMAIINRIARLIEE